MQMSYHVTNFLASDWPSLKGSIIILLKLLPRDAMLLCYAPVFVRPSVWLGAETAHAATPGRLEGPASRRRRPRGPLLQTHSSGMVCPSMRPIAKSCSSLLYVMKVLRGHGISTESLHDVFLATILAKITYCLPAWCGLCSASDRAKID